MSKPDEIAFIGPSQHVEINTIGSRLVGVLNAWESTFAGTDSDKRAILLVVADTFRACVFESLEIESFETYEFKAPTSLDGLEPR